MIVPRTDPASSPTIDPADSAPPDVERTTYFVAVTSHPTGQEPRVDVCGVFTTEDAARSAALRNQEANWYLVDLYGGYPTAEVFEINGIDVVPPDMVAEWEDREDEDGWAEP